MSEQETRRDGAGWCPYGHAEGKGLSERLLYRGIVNTPPKERPPKFWGVFHFREVRLIKAIDLDHMNGRVVGKVEYPWEGNGASLMDTGNTITKD